jgi:DNA adenine methylase
LVSRDTLKRIGAILVHRGKLRFVHGDGLEVMEQTAASWETAYFIDPPYTVAGRRLYTYNEVDHRRLFELAHIVRGDFLITYDRSDEIRGLASEFSFEVAEVAMKTTHHTQKMELFISRDLDWLIQPSLSV